MSRPNAVGEAAEAECHGRNVANPRGQTLFRCTPNEIFADINTTNPSNQTSPTRRRGAIGVVYSDGRFLVIRRSASVVAPLKFCFPGGAIEEGESEQAALVRELDEELGVAVQPLRRLWRSVTPWNVELCWWLVQLPPGVQLHANPAEVAEVHWLAADEMRELADLLESNRDFLAAVACGEICLDAPQSS